MLNQHHSSQTPRTDEAMYAVASSGNYGMGAEYEDQVVGVELARQLELELNESNEHLRRLKEVMALGDDVRITSLKNEVEKLRSQLEYETKLRLEVQLELQKSNEDLEYKKARLEKVTALNKPQTYRAFINQPSATQLLHSCHGLSGIAVEYDNGDITFYPFTGDTTSLVVSKEHVSKCANCHDHLPPT
jgi:hypothetical protein